MKPKAIALLLLATLCACEKESPLRSIETRLDQFDQVELQDAFEVYLEEGPGFSIEMEGDARTLEFVKARVEGSTLYVENQNRNKWLSPTRNKVILRIQSSPLKQVVAAEGCKVQTLNAITSDEFGLVLGGKMGEADLELDCNTFYFWNNFPTGGKVTLRGKTEVLKIWNCALMSVDARNLLARYALVENSSQGDCLVTVENKLEYQIMGTGNLLLYGNPPEVVEIGKRTHGRLIRH